MAKEQPTAEQPTAVAPSKRNAKAKKSIDLENARVIFEFADGGEPLVVEATALPKAMQQHSLLHGVSQKVGDSYSGVDTPAEARKFAEAAVEQLMNGEWKVQRESTGGGAVSLLVEALARATGHPTEKAAEVVAKLDDDQRKELRKKPAVKAPIEAIKIERAIARQKKAEAAASDGGEDLAAMFG